MGLSADFLAMLQARPTWERYIGNDSWGNDSYAAPLVIEAFVGSLDQSTGAEDGQNQQDDEEVSRVDLITDWRNIGPKDRITLQTGVVVHVESADIVHDEFGAPLMQNVIAATTRRG